MAQKSSFFNAQLQSGVYDRTYLAEDFAAYFSSFIGNGVFPDPSTGLQLTAGTGMQVSLGSGKAWINGYYYVNTSACLFTLDTADGVLNRIDSVVIRWDKTARSITAAVKKGAYAVTPAAPSLTRTEDVYELEVAEVSVSAGSTSISQSDIIDTRQNTSLCGIVAGVVDQIDTTGLFAQYNSAFQAFMASIEGTLSDDAAGNLLNLINQHKADSSVHITTLTHSKTGTVHALTGLNGAAGILSCQFKATAAFAAGNTLKVDGTSYTIKLTNGEDAEDNLFVSGAIVSCIVDTSGKTVNFKAAGGQKLPAGTTAIVKIFTANGTFTVPQTGTYRITAIGKGGDGGGGYSKSSSAYYGGGGGGAGGLAISELKLTKDASYTVTVSSATSSFGSLLTAAAGQAGPRGSAEAVAATGGTASGGNIINANGENGTVTAGTGSTGGTGGGYSSSAVSACPYVVSSGGVGGNGSGSGTYYRDYAGKSVLTPAASGMVPYGVGGGGSGTYSNYAGMADEYGGTGNPGAVIIEMVLE